MPYNRIFGCRSGNP